MADERIKIIVEGEDNVSIIFRDISDSTNKLDKSLDKAGKGMDKAGKRLDALSVALGNLAADALKAAGTAVVDFVKGSVNLASSAQETTSLLENSLGPAAEGFTEDIENLAAATNRSAIELEAGSSTIVAMTRSMGFGQEAAADFSSVMAQIAVDLGSFFNQSTEQVFQDLQAALGGSSETMQKYGIDVRETTLKNVALEMGLISQGETLDRVTRAQVLQAEVLRQASDAMGDAERTSDSYENTQRGLEAALLDLQVTIGEALLPALTELAQEVIPAVRQAAEDAAPAIEELGQAALDMVKDVSENARNQALRRELQELGASWEDIGAVVSSAGLSFEEIIEALTDAERRVFFARRENRLLELAIEGVSKGYAVGSQELLDYVKAQNSAVELGEALNEANKDLIDSEFDLEKAITGVKEVTEEQTALIRKADDATHTYEVTVEQVTEAEERRAQMQKILMDAISKSTDAQLDAAEDIFDAYDDLEDASGDYVQVFSDNSAEIADINAQLAADLSSEQKGAYEDILDTVEEGNAEWLAAYEALQGDLTEAQRRELVAQLADMEGTHGEMQSIYTGDAEAAEEAQQKINTAMEGIASGYQNMILEITRARLSQLFAEDGEISEEEMLTIELAMISLQERMGLISSDAASAMRDMALTADTAGQSFDEMLDEFLADGELTEDEIEQLAQKTEEYSSRAQGAFGLVDASVTNSQAVINVMRRVGVEDFKALQDKIGEIPPQIEDIKDAAQEYVDGSPYGAVIDTQTDIDELREYLDLLNQIGSPGPLGAPAPPPGPGAAPTGGGPGGGDTFQHGGFTGIGAGLAGMVHKNEFVFDPIATRAYGVDFLEEMQRAARSSRSVTNNYNLSLTSGRSSESVVQDFRMMEARCVV